MIGRILVAARGSIELRIVRAKDGRGNYGPQAILEKLASAETGAYSTQEEAAADCAKRVAAALNADFDARPAN
jgi:hypothetical protein